MPTRLRSTSASLRIWTVATSATSSAISQTLIPRARDARRAVLGRADMRNLEARVVCRQGDVGAALESQVDLKLNLPSANVRQCGRIVKRLLHPVAVPDGGDLDGRGKGRALVDHDLSLGTGERRQGRDAPAVHGYALGALREQQVDDVLHVLEVDQVAGLAPGVRTWHAIAQAHLKAGPVHGDKARVGPQIAELALQRLGGRRAGRGFGFEPVDLHPERCNLPAVVGAGRLQLLDVADHGLVAGELDGGREQLSPDLAREHEPRGQGDERDERERGDVGARHQGNSALTNREGRELLSEVAIWRWRIRPLPSQPPSGGWLRA